MKTTISIIFAISVFLFGQAKVAAQAASEDEDFAVVCEFQEMGMPDEGGRYWPSGEAKPLVVRFESEDFFKSEIVEVIDSQEIIGPISSRHKTISESGKVSIIFLGSNDRQLHLILGSLVSNATVSDGEGLPLKHGMCVSPWHVDRVIAAVESDVPE